MGLSWVPLLVWHIPVGSCLDGANAPQQLLYYFRLLRGLNFLIHLLLLLFVGQLKPPENQNSGIISWTQLESPCLGGFGIAASQETQITRKAGEIFHRFTLFPHSALTFLILKITEKKKKKGF